MLNHDGEYMLHHKHIHDDIHRAIFLSWYQIKVSNTINEEFYYHDINAVNISNQIANRTRLAMEQSCNKHIAQVWD